MMKIWKYCVSLSELVNAMLWLACLSLRAVLSDWSVISIVKNLREKSCANRLNIYLIQKPLRRPYGKELLRQKLKWQQPYWTVSDRWDTPKTRTINKEIPTEEFTNTVIPNWLCSPTVWLAWIEWAQGNEISNKVCTVFFCISPYKQGFVSVHLCTFCIFGKKLPCDLNLAAICQPSTISPEYK